MKFWITMIVIVGAFLVFVEFGGQKTPATQATKLPTTSLEALVGKQAPDFNLQGLDGKPQSLSSWRGKKVVLFFNEGIICYPACWNQMAALGADKQLNSESVVSASIVPDSKDNWMAAIRKMPELGQGSILFDTSTSVSNEYDVLNLPSSMHKGMKPGHTYVIIDTKGIVRYTKDDPTMGINNSTLNAEVAKIQ